MKLFCKKLRVLILCRIKRPSVITTMEECWKLRNIHQKIIKNTLREQLKSDLIAGRRFLSDHLFIRSLQGAPLEKFFDYLKKSGLAFHPHQ